MAINVNGVNFSYDCEDFLRELISDVNEFKWTYVSFAYYLNENNIEIPLSYKAINEKWNKDEFVDHKDYKECEILATSLIEYLQTLNSVL